MTFFCSMEKNGVSINWLPFELSTEEKLKIIREEI